MAEILKAQRSTDAYVDYVCKVYGQLTIPQLLEKVEATRNIPCFNRHERDNSPFTQCPVHEVNNLCSHQIETEVQETVGEPPVLHTHAAGLYRAGLYLLQTLGVVPLQTDGVAVTHSLIEDYAKKTHAVDHPCYLEYSRFTGHPLRVPLERRDDERLPSLRTTTSLPMLQNAVNEAKSECGAPINAIRDAIAGALRKVC